MLRSVEILESWLMLQEASGKAPSTMTEYRLQAMRWARWLWCPPRGRTLEEATSVDCAGYLVGLQRARMSPHSIRTSIYVLRPLYRWMVEEGMIQRSPIAGIAPQKAAPAHRSHGMSMDEVELLLRSPDPSQYLGLRDRALLQVLWELGLRRSEATAMLVSDCDLVSGRVFVRSAKGEAPRTLVLGPSGIDWLGRWLRRRGEEDQTSESVWVARNGQPITPNMVTRMVQAHAKRCGFGTHAYPSGFRSGAVHAHSLRHACATEALRDGADIVSVSRWLGHASIRSTQSYLDVDETEMEGISMRRTEIW